MAKYFPTHAHGRRWVTVDVCKSHCHYMRPHWIVGTHTLECCYCCNILFPRTPLGYVPAAEAPYITLEEGLRRTNPPMAWRWSILYPKAEREGYRNRRVERFPGHVACLEMLRQLLYAGLSVDHFCRDIENWRTLPEYRLRQLPFAVRDEWHRSGRPGRGQVRSAFANSVD